MLHNSTPDTSERRNFVGTASLFILLLALKVLLLSCPTSSMNLGDLESKGSSDGSLRARRRRRRHSLHTTRCAHAMRTCSAAQATRALTASYSTASTPSSPTLPTPTTEAGPFFRCCGVLLPRAPSTFITALPTASGTSAPLTQRAVASTPRVERVRPIRVQQAARISLADGKCGADPPTRAPVLSLGRASLHTISCVLATVCLSLDSPTQT